MAEAAACLSQVPRLSLVHAGPTISIPQIGLGTAFIRDIPGVIPAALSAGYRFFDSAVMYGNESEIGQSLEKVFKSNPNLKREDIFITSKLLPDDMHSAEAVRTSVTRSLSKFRTDYLDLYLIHWPGPGAARRKLAWQELEQFYKAGKLRAIGISNFTPKHIRELLAYAAVKPALLQSEYHPFLAARQRETVELCRAERIVFQAHSSLGGYVSHNNRSLQRHPTVLQIANQLKHSSSGAPVTPAQVLLRFSVQDGIAVIPKSSSEQHLRENLQVFDFALDASQHAALAALSNELGGGQYFDWDPTSIS